MSAFSAAASDEDGDIISALREKLGRAHALCRIRSDRIRELEAMLIGASKVEQPQDHSEQYLGMVPPGWKLVPVEPTREMKSAGAFAAAESNNGPYSSAGVYIPVDVMALMGYRAMLAAAPQPPVVVEQRPVAWAVMQNGEICWDADYPFSNEPGWSDSDQECVPLYTHPQPRQPMTTEMAELGWELHGSSDAYQAWYLAVEWTERTHKIGVEG